MLSDDLSLYISAFNLFLFNFVYIFFAMKINVLQVECVSFTTFIAYRWINNYNFLFRFLFYSYKAMTRLVSMICGPLNDKTQYFVILLWFFLAVVCCSFLEKIYGCYYSGSFILFNIQAILSFVAKAFHYFSAHFASFFGFLALNNSVFVLLLLQFDMIVCYVHFIWPYESLKTINQRKKKPTKRKRYKRIWSQTKCTIHAIAWWFRCFSFVLELNG